MTGCFYRNTHNKQFPTLPPNLDAIETRAVLRASITAHAAVAGLTEAG